MRVLSCIVAAMLAICGAARADQGWQDNQDGNGFSCFDAGSFSANNLNLSGGTYSTFATGEIVNGNPNASTAAWFIDPIAGSDSSSGLSGHPLKTNAEWARRLQGATVGFPVVTYLNDVPDADTLYVPTYDGFPTFRGAETVLSTQTVASAQPRTPASNLANEITVTGFNWTPFLNDFVRVQGTQNYAAIIKVVGTGVARLGELWNTSTSTQASSSGIGSGDVIEITKPTKGPLAMHVTGTSHVFVEDIAFDGTGSVQIDSLNGGQFSRDIIGGSSTANVTTQDVLWVGGLVRESSVLSPTIMQGTAFTGSLVSFQSSTITKLRSISAESTVFNVISTVHVDADFGQFDIPAAARGINIPGRLSTGEGAILAFNSGRHYGTGDPVSWLWSIGNTTKVFYNSSAPPTNTAGLGVEINGGSVALSSLPVLYSVANDTAAVDGTAVAGCLQQDASGNVTSTGSSCSGGSAVTSVTGTAQRISASPATGAVVIDTIGGYYSGAVSGGNEDLGTTLTNGLVCNDTTAGVAALRTCTSGTDYPAVGVATPGSCTNCSATINANGQVTSYSSGAGSGVSSVTGTAAHILASPTTGAVVVDLIATAVTPGSYTYAAFTVDADGRLTAASSGTTPVTSVTGTAGQILCTPTTVNPVCSLVATAVTPGSYTNTSLTVDSLGRITAASSGPGAFYQTWSDGTFSPLPQEPLSTAGAGLSIADDPSDGATVVSLPATGSAGSCTNCSLTFDLFGRETARASGAAPVTSVGVTAPITTTGGTTPTIGISLPANRVPFGTGTNLTSSANLTYDGNNFLVGTTSAYLGNGLNYLESVPNGAFLSVNNTSASTSAYAGVTMGLETVYGTKPVGFFGVFPASSVVFDQDSLLFELQHGGTAGNVVFSVLDSPGGGILFETNGRTKRLIIQPGGNLDTPVLSAPATPASGHLAEWADSTAKNWFVINDAGVVNHGVQSQSSTAGVAVTGIADNGSVTTQSFTVPGTVVTCGQLPAFTGAVGKPLASCVTTINAVPCGALPGFTGAVSNSGGGTCATTVNFSGLTGSAACSQLPAFTGDSTKASGSCATKNVAITETSGPTTLTIAGIPDLSPLPDVLVRDGVGANTIIGLPPWAIADYVTKHDYFVNTASLQPADTTRRYAATSQSLMDYSGVGAIEYPNDFIAGHVAYKFNIIQSVGVASSMDCWATRNGSNISASDFNFTPGTTATGVYTVAAVATGSSSASDVFGFACTYNGSFTLGPFGASIAFSVQEVLTP